MSRTSPVSETPDILERLQEESMRLCGRSISRGDLDSGLASNLADAAIYEIERLRGLVDQLNFVVSSGHAQTPAWPDRYALAAMLKKNGFCSRDGTVVTGGTLGVIDAILSALSSTDREGK